MLHRPGAPLHHQTRRDRPAVPRPHPSRPLGRELPPPGRRQLRPARPAASRRREIHQAARVDRRRAAVPDAAVQRHRSSAPASCSRQCWARQVACLSPRPDTRACRRPPRRAVRGSAWPPRERSCDGPRAVPAPASHSPVVAASPRSRSPGRSRGRPPARGSSPARRAAPAPPSPRAPRWKSRGRDRGSPRCDTPSCRWWPARDGRAMPPWAGT